MTITPVSPRVKEFCDKYSFTSKTCMTTYIIDELSKKEGESYFSLYLSFFPKDFSSTPLFFSEQEKKLLKGSQLLEFIDNRNRLIQREIREVKVTGLIISETRIRERRLSHLCMDKTMCVI